MSDIHMPSYTEFESCKVSRSEPPLCLQHYACINFGELVEWLNFLVVWFEYQILQSVVDDEEVSKENMNQCE